VACLHLSIAETLKETDWHAAAWHFREAGRPDDAAALVDSAISLVLACGQLELVRPLLDGSAGATDRPGALVLRSRLELERGNLPAARAHAEAAVQAAQATPLAGLATRNLSAMHGRRGIAPESAALASEALATLTEEHERQAAEATILVSATQDEGDMSKAADYLSDLAVSQDLAGLSRYSAVSRLNLAVVLIWLGRTEDALHAARGAEAALALSGSPEEHIAALAVRAAAALLLGEPSGLAELVGLTDAAVSTIARDEAAIEAARLLADYGHAAEAEACLQKVSEDARQAGYSGVWCSIAAAVALRRQDADAASTHLAAARGVLQDAAGRFRLLLLQARIAIARGEDASPVVVELRRLASSQSSPLCVAIADVVGALWSHQADAAVMRLIPSQQHVLSMLAEDICREMPLLSEAALARVRQEALRRPERWSSALTTSYLQDSRAAMLLGEVGGPSELREMRVIAATAAGKWLRPIVATMAQRVADRVFVEDLGRVRFKVGDRVLDRPLRRKVLALVCYLVTKPNFAATRDEAIEAVWPDLSPETAVNSLHQTIYFLRRVFEPAYKEGLSAGYVGFDGEVVTMDSSLVGSASQRTWDLVSSARHGGGEVVDELLHTYVAPFALDFAYDDWSAPYRDRLHAAVLSVVETAIRGTTSLGQTDIAIDWAHRMLAVDPHADAIELELLRAYKRGGRAAAATEQYAHYAAYMRGELGAEPPTFDEI
jgi:DNA-binding SARP family transcriptional activator